jgi:hypothetical protein
LEAGLARDIRRHRSPMNKFGCSDLRSENAADRFAIRSSQPVPGFHAQRQLELDGGIGEAQYV